MKLNPKIAEALDMDLPEEESTDNRSMVVVEPHELSMVDNEELPDMSDAETRLLEGEKQLEKVIKAGLETYNDLDDTRATVEPKFLSRHIETSGIILGHTLDAIKHKTDLQLKKMDMRMKQKGFGVQKQTKVADQQTNFFVGSREDLMQIMQGEVENAQDDGDE